MRATNRQLNIKTQITGPSFNGLTFRFDVAFRARHLTDSYGHGKPDGPVFKCTLKSLSVSLGCLTDVLVDIPLGFLLQSFITNFGVGTEVLRASKVTSPFSLDIILPNAKFLRVDERSPNSKEGKAFNEKVLTQNIERNPEIQKRMDSLFRKSISLAREKASEIIARLRNEKTNEEIRSTHSRENNGYHRSSSLMMSLFSRCSPDDTATRIYALDNKIVFPPDKLHSSYGYRIKVVTFGVTPYPFAVVLLYESEPFGIGDTLTRKEQMLVVAEVNKKFIIIPINVSHKTPEDQLEIAALMAVSCELQRPVKIAQAV